MIKENYNPSEVVEYHSNTVVSPRSETDMIEQLKNEADADIAARKRSKSNACYRCFYLLVTAH
jgi:hypothetical protein